MRIYQVLSVAGPNRGRFLVFGCEGTKIGKKNHNGLTKTFYIGDPLFLGYSETHPTTYGWPIKYIEFLTESIFKALKTPWKQSGVQNIALAHVNSFRLHPSTDCVVGFKWSQCGPRQKAFSTDAK